RCRHRDRLAGPGPDCGGENAAQEMAAIQGDAGILGPLKFVDQGPDNTSARCRGLLDGGLGHSYPASEQNGIGRWGQQVVARRTDAAAVWEDWRATRVRVPGTRRTACLPSRAPCRDHEEVSPWRSSARHSVP